MATRAGMANLITRLRAMCGGDAVTLTDALCQELLDNYSVLVDSYLTPRVPFWTEHASPFENIEEGTLCKIYYGYNTLLTETTDYTADYQRGIFTTPAANYLGLKILARAYDINAAAADGWERLAATSADAFDWSDVEGSYSPSKARDYKLAQAKSYRAKAWALVRIVERHDTAALAPNDWRGDLLRRERAGHAGA